MSFAENNINILFNLPTLGKRSSSKSRLFDGSYRKTAAIEYKFLIKLIYCIFINNYFHNLIDDLRLVNGRRSGFSSGIGSFFGSGGNVFLSLWNTISIGGQLNLR